MQTLLLCVTLLGLGGADARDYADYQADSRWEGYLSMPILIQKNNQKPILARVEWQTVKWSVFWI